jgi:hypothetical protein
MNTLKDLDTKSAGRYAFAAAMDAERQNSNNKSHYTTDEIRRAVTVRDLIDSAFSYTKLYINYRKKLFLEISWFQYSHIRAVPNQFS